MKKKRKRKKEEREAGRGGQRWYENILSIETRQKQRKESIQFIQLKAA